MILGKAIECVTLIGMAVGAEKFSADATEVMDMLLKTHGDGAELPDDDPQTSYLISAWSRICKVYIFIPLFCIIRMNLKTPSFGEQSFRSPCNSKPQYYLCRTG